MVGVLPFFHLARVSLVDSFVGQKNALLFKRINVQIASPTISPFPSLFPRWKICAYFSVSAPTFFYLGDSSSVSFERRAAI